MFYRGRSSREVIFLHFILLFWLYIPIALVALAAIAIYFGFAPEPHTYNFYYDVLKPAWELISPVISLLNPVA